MESPMSKTRRMSFIYLPLIRILYSRNNNHLEYLEKIERNVTWLLIDNHSYPYFLSYCLSKYVECYVKIMFVKQAVLKRNYKTNKEKVTEKNDENIIITIFGYLRWLRMLRERMRKEMWRRDIWYWMMI